MSRSWSPRPSGRAAQHTSGYLWRLVRLAGALTTVVVGLTSCGDASETVQSDAAVDESSSTSTASGEDPVASLPGEDELAAGLLTIDDVPTGWAEVPEDDEADEDGGLCGIRITELLGLETDSLPSARVEFAEDPDTGPALIEIVGFVPAGRGGDVLPALDKRMAGCDGETDDGWDIAISDLSFPPVGDDLAAYRMTLTDPDTEQSVHFDLVYAMSGDLATLVSAYDLYGDPTDTLATYAPKAVLQAVRTLGTTPSPS